MRISSIVILILLIAGCRSFERAMEKGIRTAISYVLPDSCDIALISKVSLYKLEKHAIPDTKTIDSIYSSGSYPCNMSIDSLRTLGYDDDSLDLVFVRNYNDTNLNVASMLKGYRLIFKEDSLKKIALIHTNKGVESSLWPEKNESMKE